MDLTHIALRAALAYLVLLGVLRLGGKRTVTQGTPFELVLSLCLGDLVDDLIWAEVSAARFLVAVAALALARGGLALAVHASEAVARWVEGHRVLLLEGGQPVVAGMRRERINEQELEELLRIQGVSREGWADVREAWLETDGVLSVQWAEGARPARKADAGRIRRRRS
jgi:uncharacterized membrane protein YcaP (DUF421 family)